MNISYFRRVCDPYIHHIISHAGEHPGLTALSYNKSTKYYYSCNIRQQDGSDFNHELGFL